MSIGKMPSLVALELVARARKLNSALLADGMKDFGLPGGGCMDASINPVEPDMVMVGTALTVETDMGDNFPIHVATYSGGPGYVMVIDGKGYADRTYFGDLIVGAAQAVGFEGMVCDGYTRDRNGCAELGLPVFSKGYLQRSPLKKNPGIINGSIQCGGVTVNPGDLVVGDCDGVTVVPRGLIEDALAKAEEKLAYERKREASILQYRKARESGETLPELAPQWVLDMLRQQAAEKE